MTLSPVFRSEAAVRLLQEEGVWARLAPAIESQAAAVGVLHSDLEALISERYRTTRPELPAPGESDSLLGLGFLQEYFFLVLFRSLFASLGVGKERQRLYAELDFCIKGTITAADNLFDDQGKSLLPLNAGEGARFLSILQLMCFERLIRRALDRGISAGVVSPSQGDAILRGLLDRMAGIGELEGSEERGVNHILDPATMVERVHRVRGGALFALAFIAPVLLEEGEVAERIRAAEPAIARLGTAFQIVDDLTDFEFDLTRHSHNLLVSQVHHLGPGTERERLAELWARGEGGGVQVEDTFRTSARAVLDLAYAEARASFSALEALGFWFPPRLADELVRAIVGIDGTARLEALAAG